MIGVTVFSTKKLLEYKEVNLSKFSEVIPLNRDEIHKGLYCFTKLKRCFATSYSIGVFKQQNFNSNGDGSSTNVNAPDEQMKKDKLLAKDSKSAKGPKEGII